MLNKLVPLIDGILEKSGQLLAVLPLLLVLVQFSVVLLVYVFSSGSIQLQESLQYINAVMFLGGAGYTALKNEHVRVDLFYNKLNEQGKAKVNFFGTIFLLMPFLALMWISGVPYVLDSWRILETSVESSGLPFVYILKTTLLLFAFTMTLHATADAIRSFKQMRAS